MNLKQDNESMSDDLRGLADMLHDRRLRDAVESAADEIDALRHESRGIWADLRSRDAEVEALKVKLQQYEAARNAERPRTRAAVSNAIADALMGLSPDGYVMFSVRYAAADVAIDMVEVWLQRVERAR